MKNDGLSNFEKSEFFNSIKKIIEEDSSRKKSVKIANDITITAQKVSNDIIIKLYVPCCADLIKFILNDNQMTIVETYIGNNIVMKKLSNKYLQLLFNFEV